MTKPKVKDGKIPKMGWGQYGKNASTIRRMKKAFDSETECFTQLIYIENKFKNA